MSFPSSKMRLFLFAYRLLWTLLLPAVLVYLVRRGRKDADYSRYIAERFGTAPRPLRPGPVWVHAVSIGEVRSAIPLIHGLLDRGEAVHVTCFTPAGRRELQARLDVQMQAGSVTLSWVPLDFAWPFRRFFKRIRPSYGLVMEIEAWPGMIVSARAHGVPLFMCNAQYPSRSYARDRKHFPIRGELMTGFAGALVKSDLQRDRFESVGVTNIAVTGELRFDQPLPDALITAGKALRVSLAGDRPVICLASVVEGEDAIMLDAMSALLDTTPRLFFVYVPRAPERFGAVRDMLIGAGLAVATRSELLNAEFGLRASAPEVDVLLGDSLGEMYGYLAMSDRVVVGGGFNPKGAHNISEALALGKPVWTGPYIWTIEYPAAEAANAGVLRLTEATGAALARALGPDAPPPARPEDIAAFFGAHAGACSRTLDALPGLLAKARLSK
jgi:3-deoxy-D-manno-octulosonic-acid transferase